MKVLLIQPPYKESTYVAPPLGISYIASVLREDGHNLKIIDAPVLNYDYSDIRRDTEKFSPDIVGITSMTPTIQASIETARTIKLASDAKIIIGGPHASIMPEETASLDNVDIVVRGEGERVMQEIANVVQSGKGFEAVKGITFGKNGKIVNNPPIPLIENLDSIPFPARDLLPMGKYKQHIGHPTSFATMITSRGCPHNCIYCTKAVFGRKYRFRSPENIVDEINHVVDLYGVKEIVFYDDSFTANRKRTLKLCESMIRNSVDVGWKCESRVDTVDSEVLKKMRDAGCRVIAYGVETGDDALLKTLKKGVTTEKIRTTFEATKRLGIETLAYIMIGIPGETKETIQKTLDFTIELDPDYVQFSIATPYPQTELYNLAIEKGYIKAGSWEDFAYAGDRATPVMRTDSLSQEDLEAGLKRIIRKFYLRPRYVFKQMKKSTSIPILKRNISGLKSVLSWIED